jgi:tetratricopeptide (TPR) repeat protein
MRASPGSGGVARQGGLGSPESEKPEPATRVPESRQRRRKAAVLVIVVAMGAGCVLAAWEWLAWRASRAAHRALSAGRYQEAHDAADRLLRLGVRRAEAQYLRAKTAIALGRRGEYLDSMKHAEALGYSRERLTVLRALIDAQYGRPASALPVLAQAFAEAKDAIPDPMVDEALARLYLERYDFPHAGAVLVRWAKDAPDDSRPPWWRAELNRRREAEPDVIIADYREVLKRAPGHREALRGIAKELERAHRDSAAGQAYDALLAIYPDDPAGHLGAGRTAIRLGDLATAISHLDRAVTLDPNNAKAHLEHAKIDLKRNEANAAIVHLDRAVALVPFDPETHYQRSLALKRLGKGEEAAREYATFTRQSGEQREREDLQERLADWPDNPELASQLARWMFTHGYDQEGVTWAKKILIDHPGHPETCQLLVDYYERLGQSALAEAFRKQASSRRP